jgi:hypothetical protein
MSASYDGTTLDHLAKHMLYLSTVSLFWFSLSSSHDHGFHLSQRLGITPHDYAALLQRGGSSSAAAAGAEAAARATAQQRGWQCGSSAVAVGSAMVALAAPWQQWQHRSRARVTAWRQRWERGGSGGGIVSTLAAFSLAAAGAAWRQRGIGGGGTINNQLKLLAPTASETATMTATTKMIKTKATAAAVAAWR